MPSSASLISAYQEGLLKHHNKHERWQGLFDIANEIPLDVFWHLFRDVLENTSVLYNRAEIIRRMLTSERINAVDRLNSMTEEDRDWWKRMIRRGKPVRVYRGAGNPNRTGFMWTTNLDRATACAYITGFDKAEIVVGNLQPSHVLLLDVAKRDIFAFPEHVQIKEFRPMAKMPRGEQQFEIQLKQVVAANGANHPLQLTPAEYFLKAAEDGIADREQTLESLKRSLVYVRNLGFTSRAETIDTIIEALDVRGA